LERFRTTKSAKGREEEEEGSVGGRQLAVGGEEEFQRRE
jgi:hypothetical protein